MKPADQQQNQDSSSLLSQGRPTTHTQQPESLAESPLIQSTETQCSTSHMVEYPTLNEKLPTDTHQLPPAIQGQGEPKKIPDQATIDALLQITRVEQERKDALHGTPMKHWWNPGEWFGASSASRKKALIRLVLFIVSSIILTVLANWLVSGALKKS